MKSVNEARRERITEKFISEGFAGLDGAQTLEILLSYAMPGVSSAQTSTALMKRFKNLYGVVCADADTLKRDFFLDDGAIALIKLLPSLTMRYTGGKRKRISSIQEASDFFCTQLRGARREKLLACFLNNRLEVISCEKISEGSITSTTASSRDLVEATMRAKGKFVMIAHNHVDRDPSPSSDDISVTRVIRRALYDVGAELLDHIIVSNTGKTCSLKKEGYIPFLET